MKKTKLDRKINDELCRCLECGCFFKQDRDLEVCDKCVNKFDTDKLWKLHDEKKLDALDFNESKKVRDKFRKKGGKMDVYLKEDEGECTGEQRWITSEAVVKYEGVEYRVPYSYCETYTQETFTGSDFGEVFTDDIEFPDEIYDNKRKMNKITRMIEEKVKYKFEKG